MTIKKKYVGNVRGLKVYRDALLFCKVMYEIAKRLPPQELYLADMMKRSSCSVVANLAEGNTNFYYKREFNFFNTSLSQLAVLRSNLDLICMQGYIDESVYKNADLRAEEILKMIIKMMQGIERHLGQDDIDVKELIGKPVLPIDLSQLFEKATTFNNHIQEIVKQYPPNEENNQIDQITRASQSILQNLENVENTSYPQQSLSYLNTSLGSVSECRAFLDISAMQNFISNEQYSELNSLGGEILDSIIERMNQLEQKYEEEHGVVS